MLTLEERKKKSIPLGRSKARNDHLRTGRPLTDNYSSSPEERSRSSTVQILWARSTVLCKVLLLYALVILSLHQSKPFLRYITPTRTVTSSGMFDQPLASPPRYHGSRRANLISLAPVVSQRRAPPAWPMQSLNRHMNVASGIASQKVICL